MPVIDVFEMLRSDQLPSETDLLDTFGKKNFAQYKALSESSPNVADNFQQLGELIRDQNTRRFNRGYEYVEKEILCDCLAAKASGINGITQLSGVIDKLKNLDSGSDARFQLLQDAVTTSQENLKSQSVQPQHIENPNLKESIAAAYDLQNKTLASRLDAQYAIYQQTTALLTTNTAKPAEINELRDYQAKAKNFLAVLLDTKSEKKIHELMDFRQAKKDLNAEYIPGSTPVRIIPKNSSSTNKVRDLMLRGAADEILKEKLKGLILRGAANEILKEKHKLLEVNENAKRKDAYEETVFLDPAQRDNHRVVIHDGQFLSRQLDNSFQPADTKNNTTKAGAGHAAFVLNNKGELSLFNHSGGEEAFYHSSLNAQAYVFGAGEIQMVNGQMTAITADSGHYRPDLMTVVQVLQYFQDRQVDISNVVVTLKMLNSETNKMEDQKYHAADLLKQLENAIPISDKPELDAEFETSFDAPFEADFSSALEPTFDASFEKSGFESDNSSTPVDWGIESETESDNDSASNSNNSPAFSDSDSDFDADFPPAADWPGKSEPAPTANDDWANFEETESVKPKR
jgi:hypothetical protein